MRCPFRFFDVDDSCDDECALLISDKTGYAVCGLIYQEVTHNNEGAIINAVNFKMVESLAELEETGNDMSGSDMPAYECSVCGYEENTCNAKFCGGCGRMFKGEQWKNQKHS